MARSKARDIKAEIDAATAPKRATPQEAASARAKGEAMRDAKGTPASQAAEVRRAEGKRGRSGAPTGHRKEVPQKPTALGGASDITIRKEAKKALAGILKEKEGERKGPGRPRKNPPREPSGRGRGRPKSEATLAKERAIAEGTYTPPKRGRPPKPKPVRKVAAPPSSAGAKARKGRPESPGDVRKRIASGKARHVPDSTDPAYGEYGIHKRGKTTVSYQAGAVGGAIHKIARRTLALGKGEAKKTVTVVRNKKESGSGWAPYHSTRKVVSGRSERTEHIRHNARDPRRTTKVRYTDSVSSSGLRSSRVESATGRRSKAYYPGHVGIKPASSPAHPKATESSVGRIPKAAAAKARAIGQARKGKGKG